MPALHSADLQQVTRLVSLCVPGDRPERHLKARGLGCDEVILDLEDAVAEPRKVRARDQVVQTLSDPSWADRTVAVRVNADNAADLEAIAALTLPRLTVIVPKVETPGEIVDVAARLRGSSVGIQALIETPAGTAAAHEIAGAAAPLVSLIIGYADLGAALGRRGGDGDNGRWLVHQERVLGAARAVGVQAIDGPFLALRDEARLVESARVARDLGFDGKWAIHPDQLEPIRAVFAMGEKDQPRSRIAAALDGERGALVVDGLMVDAAHLRRRDSARPALRPRRKSPRPDRSARSHEIGAPYADDLHVGERFAAPGLTLDGGLQTLHRAICGDRLPLALDSALAERVTGLPGLIAHPCLVTDVMIGQSTEPSGRVVGNLFYRGMRQVPVRLGATLRTETTVVGVAATRDGTRGKVTLQAITTDAHGREVGSYLRCPLLPVRSELTAAGDQPDPGVTWSAPDWDLDAHPQGEPLVVGDRFVVDGAETVTCAPELARATLNLARTHTDAQAGVYGRRLVYGGHVIAIGFAHACRALRGLVTVLGWHGCDHLAPVFEGDRLSTEIEVERLDRPVVHLRVVVSGENRPVLDWRVVVLYACA